MKHKHLILYLVVIALILTQLFRPYDSTDDIQNKERSGIKLYTDHKTGCQYLRFGLLGGTLPRIVNNRHLGCN